MTNPSNPTHAVFDEASLKRQRAALQQEAHQEILRLTMEGITETSRYIRENHFDDFDKQKGRELKSEVWEAKVKKIFPSAYFCTRTQFTPEERATLRLAPGVNVRIMGFLAPDGFQYLSSYQDLPVRHEWTLIPLRRERVAGTRRHFSAKDFPKSEYDPEKDEHVFVGDTPLDSYEMIPEVPLTGWRTDLAKLLATGLVSTEAVEQEFGSADNATWALRTGKQTKHAPEVLV